MQKMKLCVGSHSSSAIIIFIQRGNSGARYLKQQKKSNINDNDQRQWNLEECANPNHNPNLTKIIKLFLTKKTTTRNKYKQLVAKVKITQVQLPTEERSMEEWTFSALIP